MKIIKADEPLLVNNIIMMIYGEPGAGKTSFSFTADSPLLLDFDNGAHRSAYRKDAVRVNSWGEVANISLSNIKGYKTIIIDTVGRQLDYIASHIIKNNRKMSTKAGNLTLQGYGELKSIFAQWVKMVNELGVDIIFISHSKEEKDGDSIIMRPDIQGSSYGEVSKVADGIGYVRMINRRRTVDFEPTEHHVGKDTAKIGLENIPDFDSEPCYCGSLISRIKSSINESSESGKIATIEISEYRKRIEICDDLDSLDKTRVDISKIDKSIVKEKVSIIFKQKMKAMGAVWSKEKDGFIYLQPEVNNNVKDGELKNIEWYTSKADSASSMVVDWFSDISYEAKENLSPGDYEKLTSYVGQLADIEK